MPWVNNDVSAVKTDLSCDMSQILIAPDTRYELLASAYV